MDIAIIDYGSGNLRSAAKAFELASADIGSSKINLTCNPADLVNTSHIVLPGVGAFADCKAGLLAVDGMVEALHEQVINNAKPFLGICVGMQLMANSGAEHGNTEGFGWIGGDVVAIKPNDKRLKIPHMGWNGLQINNLSHPVVSTLSEDAHVYFVHSYQFAAKNPANVLATVDHGGPLTAIIGRENCIGTQFHPEKSQRVGLDFIQSFLKWRP